jgi:hypothetical protein
LGSAKGGSSPTSTIAALRKNFHPAVVATRQQ